MITLTTEQAQQIEEAFDKARIGLRGWELLENRYAAINAINPALATIRAAISQAQEPVAANCPKCKSEISHWSWCPDFVQPVSQKQEPVAWANIDLDAMVKAFDTVIEAQAFKDNPFHNPINSNAMVALRILRGLIPAMKSHAHPVRTKDLTDDEVAEITKDFGDSEYRINRISCARAVIAADKEKNK